MKNYSDIIKEIKSPQSQFVDIVKLISEQIKFPSSVVKKGIRSGHLTINSKPVNLFSIELRRNTEIKFQGVSIDMTSVGNVNEFDLFIDLVLKELGLREISSVTTQHRKILCSYVILYFCNYQLETVIDSESKQFEEVVKELELIYKEYFKDVRESRIPRRKELIEILTNAHTDVFIELEQLISNLKDGIFNNALNKFLQEYSRVTNKGGFQYLIAPLLSSSLYSRHALESLIKPIREVEKKSDAEDKFLYFNINKEVYVSYNKLIDNNNHIHAKIYNEINIYLNDLFKKICDALEEKSADLIVTSTQRKYNFKNTERSEYDLLVLVQNIGDGLAREVVLSSNSEIFDFESVSVGILKPNEVREISIYTSIKNQITDPVMHIKCCWASNDGVNNEKHISLIFRVQNVDVPWDKLETLKPYSIQEIEDKDKLFGRDEILRQLEHNIRSVSIDSYKLWGQKRVGKSSIVKTLKSLFSADEKIIIVWRSIAGLKNTDPILTLNTLGESICSEIFEELRRKTTNSAYVNQYNNISIPEFNGSLFPLEGYIKKLKAIDAELKFIFIIDEFDRINEEFFLPGNLGDSFSLNIGKGLNSLNYVGFILVGSENMHLLDRQEINYNSFHNREVDTFNKKSEYNSYKKIITGPVDPYINFSEEAIEYIFDVTSGNPYFSNLICSNIFLLCFKNKDNEVDINTVKKAVSSIVDSYQKSHFEHFWADGITDESSVRREKKADIRRRVLVSYSFSHFQSKLYPTKVDLLKNFKKPLEYEVESYEIENAIVEFFNRKIFIDANTSIRIKPKLFEMWLCGPGRTLMIEGISDLEALQREKQKEIEHSLKYEELSRLSDTYIFKGQKSKVQDYVKYFNQFGGPFEQRRIFALIERIIYFSKDAIINFYKSEQKNIFRKKEITIKSSAKSLIRENVELYGFPDTIDENNEVFDVFKLYTHIRKSKSLKNIRNNSDAWKSSAADDIIIFDSILDDFKLIENDLKSIFDERLIRENIPVKLVVLIITSRAKTELIKEMSNYSNFKLVHFQEIDESKIMPFIDTTEIFANNSESSYSLAEVRKCFPSTSKRALNILFETHCPAKSIPILWCNTSHFTSLFVNDFGKLEKIPESEIGEEYRDRVYFANKKFIQSINPFLINYLKQKSQKLGKVDWFISDFIPKPIMDSIFPKWTEEGCSKPYESYFDLIHYKDIIKKNHELLPIFQMKEGGGDGLSWFIEVNKYRRDPAHPEKPPPTLQQAEYFEKITEEIIDRINKSKLI